MTDPLDPIARDRTDSAVRTGSGSTPLLRRFARVAMRQPAARLTERALGMGIVGALGLLPLLRVSIPAGVVVDRFDTRFVSSAGQTIRGADSLALGAPVLHDALTLRWLLTVVVLYSAREPV